MQLFQLFAGLEVGFYAVAFVAAAQVLMRREGFRVAGKTVQFLNSNQIVQWFLHGLVRGGTTEPPSRPM